MKKILLTVAGSMFIALASVNAQERSDTTGTQTTTQQEPSTGYSTSEWRDEDREMLSKDDLPSGLVETLKDDQYEGWENATIYRNKTSDEYMLVIQEAGEVKTFYFDKEGKALHNSPEGSSESEQYRTDDSSMQTGSETETSAETQTDTEAQTDDMETGSSSSDAESGDISDPALDTQTDTETSSDTEISQDAQMETESEMKTDSTTSGTAGEGNETDWSSQESSEMNEEQPSDASTTSEDSTMANEPTEPEALSDESTLPEDQAANDDMSATDEASTSSDQKSPIEEDPQPLADEPNSATQQEAAAAEESGSVSEDASSSNVTESDTIPQDQTSEETTSSTSSESEMSSESDQGAWQSTDDAAAGTEWKAEDRVLITTNDIPSSMLITLGDPKYRGWENSSVYRNRTTNEYMVEIRNGSDTKTYYFDKDGKAIEKSGSSSSDDHQDQ